jgi:antitoxin (DNA-binding transcriptional repressor) of toxin-antitoxin stability system
MLKITIRDFSRNMKDVSERVAQGESFLITKNSDVIFEIKPKIKKEEENLPIISNKAQVIQNLQIQIQEKLEEISSLNQHINILLKEDI